MKQLMGLLVIVFFVPIQAEDNLKKFNAIYKSQSEICRFIIDTGITTQCIIDLDPADTSDCPDDYIDNQKILFSTEEFTIIAEIALVCAPYTDEEIKVFEEENNLMTYALCIQPLLNKYIKENKCYTFDYSQTLKVLYKHNKT